MKPNEDRPKIRVIDLETGDLAMVFITLGPAKKDYPTTTGEVKKDERQFSRDAEVHYLVDGEECRRQCWPEKTGDEVLWVTRDGRKFRESDEQNLD